MANKSGDLGRRAETAVARYLAANGWPSAEVRARRGRYDPGDLTGTPGICWEVKGGKAGERAIDSDLAAWLAETETEKANTGADYGVLVTKRAAVGYTRAGEWYAWLPCWQLEKLLRGEPVWRVGARFPVRLHLGDLVQLLHHAGYGTPPSTTSADDLTATPARDSAAITVANL